MHSSHLTLLNQARQNHARGDTEKSLVLLKKLLEISRSDGETQATAYYEIGKIYTFVNKDDLAIKFFKKAISIYPDVLVQEFEWFQNLKLKNKQHIYAELEKAQSEFKDYLFSQTRDFEGQTDAYVHQSGSQYERGSVMPTAVRTREQLGGANTANYAGFWKRVVSSVVDSLIILFVNLLLLVILVYGFGLTATAFTAPVSEEAAYVTQLAGRFMGYIVWYFVSILFWWLYYAIMESSRYQGTIGKLLIGIYVTDQSGNRIGVGRATGRYFLKTLLLSLPFINLVDCIMVALSSRKQAWHDMPVDCLILSKTHS